MKHLLIIILTFSINHGFSQESCSLNRKELKEINRLFGSDFDATLVDIHGNLSSRDNFNEGDCVYLIERDDNTLGYLLSTRAKGRFDYFDYIVLYSSELSVNGIAVIVYRSINGGGICQKKWLSQFQGYSGKEIALGKDIDAISGSTISATSMVKDIQRCQRLMISLRQDQIIE